MARGYGERPERSPSGILSAVEFPISRDELALTAAEAGAPADAINFLRSLPDRVYQSPSDVLRAFGEGSARFGLFSTDVRHREDLGRRELDPGAASRR